VQHVYYVREDLMKRAICVRTGDRAPAELRSSAAAAQIARENLIALGVCIGKFTHSSKFILTVGALELLAQHAKFKVRRCCGSAPRMSIKIQSSNRRAFGALRSTPLFY
jgi:hypothetical protein